MIKPLLDIQQVSLTLSGMDKSILSNISYSVYPGDFIVVLGSNGSGKSSLLKLIDQRYALSSGKINLDEKSITEYPIKKYSHLVKTLTQDPHDSLFPDLTVLENYLIIKQLHDSHLFTMGQRSENTFFSEYLNPFNVALSLKLDQVVEKLSGGEKQALALALTMLYPPRILLLDEHTSALDPKSAGNIMALTKEMVSTHHMTCILTTHDLSEAQLYGNRILALKNGEVYQTIEQDEKEKLTQDHLLLSCY